MKKQLLIYVLCLVLIMHALVGCSATISNDKLQGDNIINHPTNNSENRDEATYPVGDNHGMPMDRPEFTTFSEIKNFLCDANNSTNETNNNIYDYVSQNSAPNISKALASITFPVTNESEFSATYFKEYNSLDVIYRINEIQYRFIYYFESDYVWNSEDAPALEDVQVGPHKVDFWQIDHPNFPYEYYGFVKQDGVYLQITMLGEDLSGISFDAFSFVPLSSIGGTDVA